MKGKCDINVELQKVSL